MTDDLATLTAIQALRDVVATLANATDRADAALMMSAMHADAEVSLGVMDGTGAALADALADLIRTTMTVCFHSLGQSRFAIDGDRARGETHVTAYFATGGDAPAQTLTGGRYLDRFERRGGVWKLAERRFVQEWATALPGAGMRLQGGYAPDDPSTAFWA
jgi:hypothetical protein